MSTAARTWRSRPVFAWALYDWANSAFALCVMTAFVPVMLGGLWNDGAASTVTTFRLGLANGLASACIVILAPLLGVITDQAGRRKSWLAALTALGVLATAALAIPGTGGWQPALFFFGLASIAFFSAGTLYDALLLDVADADSYDRVSALGYGLGYLGGALIFLLSVAMLAKPTLFGLDDAVTAMRVTFVLVSIWWTVFTLPLLFWVKERRPASIVRHPGLGRVAGQGLRELGHTFRTLRVERNLLLFLAAYWLYIDGVYTIIKMAVDYGLSQGLTSTDVTGAILLTNLVGFPAAIGFGVLAGRIGTRTAIYLALGVYVVATTAAVFLTTAAEFYALAFTIGLVQGGVQSLSRSFYARLIPPDKSGEYFGFFNMVGKFSSILGPVLAGTAALLTGSQRFGILSIVVLFAAGLLLLTRVRVPPSAGGP